MDYTIEVNNLTRIFGKFVAVNAINFNVRPGEIFGFLGPHGAGKSTTIRMLCGIIPPSGGTATVAGYDVMNNPENVKSSIGYMSQKFSLYEDLTVSQNIDFYSGIYNVKKNIRKERKSWVLEITGLKDNIDTVTSNLSGGWKQRLALACAVIHNPKVLFLDEPTAGVDPLARRRFWDLIYETAAGGTTVFVTTHYLDEAENCNRLALIYNGDIIALGTPAEVKSKSISSDVLEIECSDCIKSMDLLIPQEFVSQVTPFGNKLHIIVKSEEKDVVDIVKKILSSNNIELYLAKFETPTLEDVFIYLITQHTKSSGEKQ